MNKYVIAACNKCGGYFLAKSQQKTKTCPYCNSKIMLHKARKIASFADAREATALLKSLKEKAAAKRGSSGFKSHF
ncbi:DUF1922 domain-containing protein [Candidatus Bathyarchaeota archaeon]|nr:DUF1922 domain-containing protein [Candidatus Bathyarchaeota archaeon]